MSGRKGISILGSTGSIGVNALDVIDRYPDRFEVIGITAWGNSTALKAQILRHRPKVACVGSEERAEKLRRDPEIKVTEILHGIEGLLEVATVADVDMVVSAIVGSSGLMPTFAAVEAGKDIALANKETLVAAGNLVMAEAYNKNVKVLPVDSEHSAIYQSLAGHRRDDVKKLILTASGGPFIRKSKEELKKVTVKDALNHPTWSMGNKITIDSATLMNKGLEVIEAKWLFDVSGDRIDVLVHPQSIIHSMVEYIDGSVVSQMGMPDMRGPIAYALSYPERLEVGTPVLDLGRIGKLTFEKPDLDRFPALGLCYEALEAGGTSPAVISAANEVAVDAFLAEKIKFVDIPVIMDRVLKAHTPVEAKTIEEVLRVDRWARDEAAQVIKKLKNEE
ncbi:MAG: 1-deoxy-D-xylulose-5-phosphate reductoisomerase [Proteobacteria bacterium]|nr:1-deoxy-D-xylulose-5-phosphate reductoisomerase [Pseudomonadota bacterium]